jgi:hypothetical protein
MPIVAVIAGSGLAVSAVTPAAATPTLYTEVSVSAFNGNYGSNLAYDGSTFSNTPSANLDYTTSFAGLNSQDDSQTMDIHAVGTADAAPGALKASSSLTISNPFYNAANPVYTDQSFNVDPNGVPDQIEVGASARLFDNLSVSSAAPISTLQVSITIDGTTSYSSGLDTGIFSSPAYTQASVAVLTDTQGHTCGSCGGGSVQGPGTFNQTYTLTLPVSNQNAVAFGLIFYTYNWFDLTKYWGYSEAETYTIDMDFSHTVNINGFQGLDSNGSIVALNGVTGSDGFAYPLTAVPEAETYALMLAGLGLIGWRARRRG